MRGRLRAHHAAQLGKGAPLPAPRHRRRPVGAMAPCRPSALSGGALLSPYLDQALDIPSERCSSWLQSIAARDAALAADLEAVLAEQRAVQQARFLEHAVARLPRLARGASLEGQVVGAYRLRLARSARAVPAASGWRNAATAGSMASAAVKLLNMSRIGRGRRGAVPPRRHHPRPPPPPAHRPPDRRRASPPAASRISSSSTWTGRPSTDTATRTR